MPDIFTYLSQPFAQHALLAAGLVAVMCGLIGPFVIMRNMAFAVHGTSELPLEHLLGAHGITLKREEAATAQRLGLRVSENGAVQIKTVLRGGLAEQAGMSAGDEWIGIEVRGQGWRIGKLDDIALYAGAEKEVTALVARDRRLLRLPLALEPRAPAGRGRGASRADIDTLSLDVADAAQAARWLDAP